MAFLFPAQDAQPNPALPGAKTFLDAVARVVRATGQIPPANLSAESPEHVQRAMAAVQDAYDRVYHAAFWQFRRVHAWLELEDEVAAYVLPEDFAARGGNIIQMSDYTDGGEHRPRGPVRYVDYERLIQIQPEYRFAERRNAGPLSERQRDQAWIREVSGGPPELFTIYGTSLMVYPVPSATKLPDDWSLDVLLTFPYYRRAEVLTDSSDVVNIPFNLHAAHHFLALGYYKQSQEYSDFQADEARGERHLAEQITAMNAVAGDLETAFAEGLIG